MPTDRRMKEILACSGARAGEGRPAKREDQNSVTAGFRVDLHRDPDPRLTLVLRLHAPIGIVYESEEAVGEGADRYMRGRMCL